jgi:8-oxo-dGTP pyrophosphatase MutT (NUDIX family)
VTGEPAKAAVLVPVYRDGEGELRLVLVRRAGGGVHGGQMAFPGGRPEPGDRSLVETALRETEEEIGLPRASVTVLEQLPDVITLSSGYCITPFLARVEPPPQWDCDANEIDAVVVVSAAHLATARDVESREWPPLPGLRRTEFFRLGTDKVWGATYRILDPLLGPLIAGRWQI